MTAEQLARFRTLLEEQLIQLDESSNTREGALDESQSSGDIAGADRAAELELFEVEASIADSEHHLAAKIHHAITRIDDGSYGLCEACGNAITVARLEAKPSVSLCLNCQEAHEIADREVT
jgi:DnaK suppressor protein